MIAKTRLPKQKTKTNKLTKNLHTDILYQYRQKLQQNIDKPSSKTYKKGLYTITNRNST